MIISIFSARHEWQVHATSKRSKRKVYVQAWQPILIEQDVLEKMLGGPYPAPANPPSPPPQLPTVFDNPDDDESSAMSVFLDDFDKELEACNIIERLKTLYYDDIYNMSQQEIEIAFELVTIEKPFSSEEESNNMKNRVLKMLISDDNY